MRFDIIVLSDPAKNGLESANGAWIDGYDSQNYHYEIKESDIFPCSVS